MLSKLPERFDIARAGDKLLIFAPGRESEVRALAGRSREELEVALPGSFSLQGRGRPLVVSLNGKMLVLRHGYHGGLLRSLTRDLFWGGGRLLKEISVLAAAKKGGIDVPEVVGGIVTECRGGLTKLDLITTYLPGTEDLLSYYRNWKLPAGRSRLREKRAIIRRAADQVARLHNQGIFHADLQLKNILIGRTGEDIRVFLLDFDRSYQRKRLSPAARRRNLARLYRSFQKVKLSHPDLSERDCLVFLSRYLSRLSVSGKREFRLIIKKTGVGCLHLLFWKWRKKMGGGYYARPFSGGETALSRRGDDFYLEGSEYHILAPALVGRRSRVFQIRTPAGRRLALKLPVNRDRETLRALKREARKARRLDRAGLPHAALVDSGRGYVLQEWISGVRGDAWFRQWREEGSSPASPALLRLQKLFQRALRHRIYVRDLNQNNIIWNGVHWVIIDCGSVKRKRNRRKVEQLYRQELEREWSGLLGAGGDDFLSP